MYKICKTCKKEKTLDEFSKRTGCKLGKDPHCRDCKALRAGFVPNNLMDYNNEIWKDVVGWEGVYMISSFGRIKRCHRRMIDEAGRVQNFREKILRPWLNNGYWHYKLIREGELMRATLHRLVAEAFIPNPLNKKEVNHKNRNRADNRVDNLEWATRGENLSHAIALIKKHNSQDKIY